MWPFLEGGKFAIAQLVEDAPGVLVPEVVDPRALPVTERAQRRRRELGRERQGLQAREDAVATEHRHEPRQAGGGQALSSADRWGESESREVHEAAAVRRLQRLPVGFDVRRPCDPALQILLHGRLAPTVRRVLRAISLTGEPEHRDDVEFRLPLPVRPDLQLEGQTAPVHLRRLRRRDPRRPGERLALVRQDELAVLDVRLVRPLLLERVLDLEEIGEVGFGVDTDRQLDGFVFVVQDRQVLVKAVADGALSDDRQLGVHVHGSSPGHEEEARLEVLQIVLGERVELLPVDRQQPFRQEARVEREQTSWIG